MSALTLIAHAGNWATDLAFIVPSLGFVIYLAVTTLRDRRAREAEEREEKDHRGSD